MKDVLDDVEQWLSQGLTVAIATVVKVEGSGPKGPGAVMAVNNAGEVAGSVSGGCVEGAVVEEAMQVLAGGKPRIVTYGAFEELGFSVSLTCGGTVHVFVECLNCDRIFVAGDLDQIFKALRSEQPFALCTMVEGPCIGAKMGVPADLSQPVVGSLGNPELDQAVIHDAQGLLVQGLTSLLSYDIKGEIRQGEIAVFIESFVPPQHVIIFGAIDFTRGLCKVGKVLGYRVTVCDARSRFATLARFPEADEVVVEWPDRYLTQTKVDERTIIVVLTHDPKFDVPALTAAVRTDAAYIGAMGSRRTHIDRLQRLQEAGLCDRDLLRISAPIGLDIGARTPEETAISIFAEVIALRSGHKGGRLTQGSGSIHSRVNHSRKKGDIDDFDHRCNWDERTRNSQAALPSWCSGTSTRPQPGEVRTYQGTQR